MRNTRKYKGRSKAFRIINVILIIYVFTLGIGYSLFGESLKISGTASTAQDMFIWESDTVISGLTKTGIEMVKSQGGELIIPEGVTEIAGMSYNLDTGEGAFDKGFSPMTIGKLDPEDPEFETKLFSAEYNFITSVTFPSTLKKIGYGAFTYCVYLSKITFLEGIEQIDDYAFLFNLGLTGDLYIPDSVKSIGLGAFAIDSIESNKLTKISISKNTSYHDLTSSMGSFLGRIELTKREPIIPDYVPSRDMFIWESDTVISGLTETGIKTVKEHSGYLIIPEGVTEIYTGMEEAGATIQTLSKGFSPIAIGKINVDTATEEDLYNPEINFIKKLKLPNTLKKIGGAAFVYSVLEGKLVIPDSVTEMGMMAFQATKINSLSLGNGLQNLTGLEFASCIELTGALVIPDQLKMIGVMSFAATKITSLKIGTGVERIEFSAFSNCYELTGELYIPDNVKYIGGSAFAVDDASLNKITKVSLGKNTTLGGGGVLDRDFFKNRPEPIIRQ